MVLLAGNLLRCCVRVRVATAHCVSQLSALSLATRAAEVAGRRQHHEKADRGGVQKQAGPEPGRHEGCDHFLRTGENVTAISNWITSIGTLNNTQGQLRHFGEQLRCPVPDC